MLPNSFDVPQADVRKLAKGVPEREDRSIVRPVAVGLQVILGLVFLSLEVVHRRCSVVWV